MKSASKKEDIVALVLVLAPALALLLSVCGVQTLSEQFGRFAPKEIRFPPAPRHFLFRFAMLPKLHRRAEILSPRLAPTIGLAMADFTGDTHPDLAAVALDRVDSANAHYWIEIRLTEGGGQILQSHRAFRWSFYHSKGRHR